MAKSKCPYCGEVEVLPGIMLCVACHGYGKDSVDYRAWAGEPTVVNNPPAPFNKKPPTVSNAPVAETPPLRNGSVTPGEVCPTCDERKPKRLSSTERVKEWRKKNAD